MEAENDKPNEIIEVEKNDVIGDATENLAVVDSNEAVPVELPKARSASLKKQSSNEDENLPDKIIEKQASPEKMLLEMTNAEKVSEKSIKSSKDKTNTEKSIKSHGKPPIDLQQKSSAVKVNKPNTALRSAALRPVSARPSAPRRRDRNVKQILHTENLVSDSNNQNKDDKKNFLAEFDDADNIVITDAIQDNIASIDAVPATDSFEIGADDKQGHLVKQILETQTAILKSDAKNEVTAVSRCSHFDIVSHFTHDFDHIENSMYLGSR